MDDRLTLLTRANAREILAAFKLDRLGRISPWQIGWRGFLRDDFLVKFCDSTSSWASTGSRLPGATYWRNSPAAFALKVGSMSRDVARCWEWPTIQAWSTPWPSGLPWSTDPI